MDLVLILGILLVLLGVLTVFGWVKLLPNIKIAWIVLIAGIVVLAWTPFIAPTIGSLAVGVTATPSTPSAGDNSQFTYSVLGAKNGASDTIDLNSKVILVPETYNATNTSVNIAYVSANFTIAITDPYNDMRGVPVSCTTPTFYTQNATVSDSTQYMIVTKDSGGLPDIRIYDTSGTYSARTRSFLLGGQSSTGQSVTVRVWATVDPTSVGKLNTYNSQDVTCNVAGQSWALRVSKSSQIA